MLDIPSISGILAAIGVVVGVAFTIAELRNLVKQRQTDLIVSLYSIFATEKFQKDLFTLMTDTEINDYDTFKKKYAVNVPPTGLFFHELGVLLRKKLIDIGLVNNLFGGLASAYWEKNLPMVEDARKKLGLPDWGDGYEYLYNELKKKQQTLQPVTA